MIGTTIAQVIPIVVSPILTRIYTPEDFGLFALYMSINSIVSIVITGRYELAIMLPEKKVDAINITALSITLTALFSMVIFLLVHVFNNHITYILGVPEISAWLYLLPVTLLLTGIHQTLNVWSGRNKRFIRITLNKIVQNLSTAILNVSIGFLTKSKGLILSTTIGKGIACITMIFDIIKRKEINYKEISFTNMKLQAIRYSNFPRYTAIAHVIESAAVDVPNILLSIFFGAGVVGHFSLSRKMVIIPITVISGAIGDVFFQRASHEYNINGKCDKLFLKTLLLLMVIGLPIFLFLFLFAPGLFAFVFGEEWRIAGKFTQIMAAPFYLQFVGSPLSHMFRIARKQFLELILQSAVIILVVMSLIIGYFLINSLMITIALVSTVYAAKYIIFLICSFIFSKGK